MGLSVPREATCRAITMRWSWREVYSPPLSRRPPSSRAARVSPQTTSSSPSMRASTPICRSISRMASARLDSLVARRPTPAMRLSPAQNAARTEIMGKRSGAFERSCWKASSGAFRTQTVPPSSCETTAPASTRMSMTLRSACREVVSIPTSSAEPKMAPATRKLAAALQSPSMSKSAAR